jgi:hypothetical protein
MAIGNFQPSPLGRSSRNDGTCSYCTSVRPECMCRWAIPNSKSRLESPRLSYLYMDQLLCPLRQRCHWCCTNWAEHLDHHQARKPSSTKPSEGFTADGSLWGQRPLAVPFRYGRDAPRSDDLREIRIGPPVQYSLVAIAKSVVLKTGVAFLITAASASTRSSAPTRQPPGGRLRRTGHNARHAACVGNDGRRRPEFATIFEDADPSHHRYDLRCTAETIPRSIQ